MDRVPRALQCRFNTVPSAASDLRLGVTMSWLQCGELAFIPAVPMLAGEQLMPKLSTLLWPRLKDSSGPAL